MPRYYHNWFKERNFFCAFLLNKQCLTLKGQILRASVLWKSGLEKENVIHLPLAITCQRLLEGLVYFSPMGGVKNKDSVYKVINNQDI